MEGVCLIYKEAVKPADKRYKDPERNGEMRILVVEDDLTIQTQLKTLLSGNGYEVDTVKDFSRVI